LEAPANSLVPFFLSEGFSDSAWSFTYFVRVFDYFGQPSDTLLAISASECSLILLLVTLLYPFLEVIDALGASNYLISEWLSPPFLLFSIFFCSGYALSDSSLLSSYFLGTFGG